MKVRGVFLVMLIISVVLLSGCQKAETAQTPDDGTAGASAAPGAGGDVRNPELDNVSRLTLGTFELEGGDNAITPEQAAKLLPLWKLIQGGTLTNVEETNAVIKQIEGQMTEAQLTVIDALGLTMDDMLTWMQAHGVEVAASGSIPGDGQNAPEGMPTMTDEEREQMRQRFENMTEEERAAAMAEGGFQRPGGASGGTAEGQAPGGGRQFGGGFRGGNNTMLEPLIALLTERAAQ